MTRTVWLVIRRELRARLRGGVFVAGTALVILVLVVYLALQSLVVRPASTIRVGLTGQATGVQQVLQQDSGQLGLTLATTAVPSVAAGAAEVRVGTLDVLVSGPPDGLQVIVRDSLDDRLRAALDSVVRQQVVYAALAEAGLRPADVQAQIDAAHAQVTSQSVVVEPGYAQRRAVALAVTILLSLSLLAFGVLAANGGTEEKSSRVAEMLLATVRPGQLLFGRLIGLGTVGLAQLLIIGVVGVSLSLATGALTQPSLAWGAVGAAVLWYLLGFLLYATAFAAAGSLVSRPERLPAVTAPPALALGIGLAAGIVVLAQDPTGVAATVLSVLPPFAPMIMSGRMALGAASGWQVLLAALLTLAAVVVVAWLAERVHRHSILRTDGRIRLRDAMR
jgi:ABC-2 type transport system permease protein